MAEIKQRTPLALKYRPQHFEDVVEQNAIKQILSTELKTGNLKRCMLFCGPAGCGKTTNARIFAGEIEKNKSNIVEINCADNTGVEDVRKLVIEPSQIKPLVGQYKVFVLDECFEKGTMVSTPDGKKPIESLKVGDLVYNLCGVTRVTAVRKKHVPYYRTCGVLVNNKLINTTRDHLFFTEKGWVAAQNLHVGDRLYDRENLSELWEDISNIQQEVLLQGMLSASTSETENDKRTEMLQNKTMCDLWETVSDKIWWTNVFQGMYAQANFFVGEKDNEFRVWDGTTQVVFRKNEKMQPLERFEYDRKSKSYKGTEWNITYLERKKGWKWELYQTTDAVIRKIRQWMDLGISCKNSYKTEQQSDEISYELQVGPCLTSEKAGDRGGWQFPQVEKWYAERCKETEMFGKFRVESLACIEPNDIRRIRHRLSDDSVQYVEMYDLQVAGHPSYFVEDVLVHNCHMLTTQSQNALLKILEEPPSYCVFILCTTDPQKVLPTIMSRAVRYDFQLISHQGIIDRLNYILNYEKQDPEGIDVETWDMAALDMLSTFAQGHMRNAVVNLEKVLSFTKNITVSDVEKVLGVTSYDILFNILNCIINKDQAGIIQAVDTLAKSGMDLKLFVKNFLSFVLEVNKYVILRDINPKKVMDLVTLPSSFSDRLSVYNNTHKQILKLVLSSMVELNSSLKWETDVRPVLETNLLLMAV